MKRASSSQKSKPCEVCGRTIEWRKKWERSWESVKYCSDRCRAQKAEVKKAGAKYEATILEILQSRAQGLTMCPSEVLTNPNKQNPELMERVREAARRLVAQGKIEILQRGRVVDPSSFRGPIRLRLK
jgi:hypothetical protein